MADGSSFVALTDYNWFSFLRQAKDIVEVNFWRPSPKTGFRAIPANAPFLFQLKVPHHAIGGFGYFVSYSRFPLWLAWDSFGVANGAPDLAAMQRLIGRYAKGAAASNTVDIGCIMIAEPIFFQDNEFIRLPANWPKNIQVGKKLDLQNDPEGRRIWGECLERATARRAPSQTGVISQQPRYGELTGYRPRLGQGLFRALVTDAYGRACAVTREHSLPVLEAAHIKPFAEQGEHDVRNGLLLRSDIHRLFDKGYVTVTPEHRFLVSKKLKRDFSNGRSYYPLHQRKIAVPTNTADCPTNDSLKWHNREIFRL